MSERETGRHDEVEGGDGQEGDGGNCHTGGDDNLGGQKPGSSTPAPAAPLSEHGMVTFEGETAGYKNALGMYKIGADGSISNVQILFANASLKGSGGDLVGGKSTVDVSVRAGDKVGFFIIPDGYSQRGMSDFLTDTKGSFKFVDPSGKGHAYGMSLRKVATALSRRA